MTIKEVQDLAKEKKIPRRIIDRFLSEIETDGTGKVKDEFAVIMAINEIAYNTDVVRGNLEAVRRMKENRINKK